MLSALLKKQLQEIFRSYFYNAKQGKACLLYTSRCV